MSPLADRTAVPADLVRATHRMSLAATWPTPRARWYSDRRNCNKPSATHLIQGLCVDSIETARVLFGGSLDEIEALPVDVEGETWWWLNCLRSVEEYDEASSEILQFDVPPDIQVPIQITWLNLLDRRAESHGIFTLRQGPNFQLLWTDSAVERYRSAGLCGLEFRHVGYCIPDAAHAVAKPPPPSAPAPAPHVRRARPLKLVELSAGERRRIEAVRESIGAAPAAGGRDAGDDGSAAIAVLGAQLDALRSLASAADGETPDAALEAQLERLVVAYGDLICRACGWSWAALASGRSKRWLCVASPEGRHALPVESYVFGQVDAAEPTLVLQFNMIRAGALPPAGADVVVLG